MTKLAKQDKTAELYIYGVIGDDWGGITPGEVVEALNNVRGAESLTVRINSEGGKVSDGVAIMNRLMDFPASVHVEVDGLAASAASVIAMAGDRITMGTATRMMVHDPWCTTAGGAAELRKTADVLDGYAEDAAKIYSGRTGISVDEVRAMMAAETWMNADEAIALNFADDAVEREVVAAKWDLSHFAKTPDCIAAMCREPAGGMSCVKHDIPISTLDYATPQRDYRATQIKMRRKFAAS